MQNNTINPTLQNNAMMMQAMLMQQMNRQAVNPQMNAAQIQQMQQMQSLRNQQIPSSQNNGMQGLSPEQQLIQQKNLIDQLERQIAQHQSQVAQNNNSNDNGPRASPSDGTGGAATPQPSTIQHKNVQGRNAAAIGSNLSQGSLQNAQMQSQLQGQNLSSPQMQLQNQLQMNAMMQNNIFKSMNMNISDSGPGQPQPNQTGSLPNQRPGSKSLDETPNQNQNQNNMMNSLMMNGRNGMNTQLALKSFQNMNSANSVANGASTNNNANQSIGMGTKERESSSGSGSGVGSNDKNANLMENLNPTVLPIRSGSADLIGSKGNDDANSQQGSSMPWDWQTNSDTPERKRVLFGIMKVIETVQDDSKQNPEK